MAVDVEEDHLVDEPLKTREPPRLRTERLELRPFALADAERVRELAGDAEIAKTTASIPHPYKEGMAEERIRSLPGLFEREDLIWAVVRAPHGLIGSMELKIERNHARAELGYWIGVPYQRNGYAPEAGRAVCGYAFATLLASSRVFQVVPRAERRRE